MLTPVKTGHWSKREGPTMIAMSVKLIQLGLFECDCERELSTVQVEVALMMRDTPSSSELYYCAGSENLRWSYRLER